MPRVSGVSVKDIDLSLVIPLMIHGDGADSHRRRSFMITTVGSVVTQGSMWDTRFVCYVFDEARAAEDSLATLDAWVCWSLLEAQMGHYLDLDPFGRPYAPYKDHGRRGRIMRRYRAVLALHKGDEKYLQKTYRSSNSAVGRNICMVCKASSETGPLLYTLHGVTAPHRQTLMDTPTFIEEIAGVHTWVQLPGWGIQVLCHDWLHVVDLTLVPEASASALLELCHEGIFGLGSLDEKLRRAHVLFVKACRAEKVRTFGLTCGMKHGNIAVQVVFT